MSSFMPFSFNAVELCVTTINEKPWTRAREVCRAPEYNKKTADIVKTFSSKENYAQKYQTISVTSAGKPVDWPKDSQKYDIYTNEEGMYELSFSSQQPKAKDFRRHCFNVLFPHAQQHLSDKSHAMEIEDLTSRVQALEITNEAHQQTIEDKNAAPALLNDDLQNGDNEIQAIQYENGALQAQRDVYRDQLQKCQDIITHLKASHVPHGIDPGKDNTVMIIEKNTDPEEDEFYEYFYYFARIQQRFITTKKTMF